MFRDITKLWSWWWLGELKFQNWKSLSQESWKSPTIFFPEVIEQFQNRHEVWSWSLQRNSTREVIKKLWIWRLNSCWPVLGTIEALGARSVLAMGQCLSSEAAREAGMGAKLWRQSKIFHKVMVLRIKKKTKKHESLFWHILLPLKHSPGFKTM